MKRLTRAEMWIAIIKKYPSLDCVIINSLYTNNQSYIQRDKLLKILLEMKIHKSRHLTKEQKMRIQNEINSKIVEAL